jgi:predicted RecB family nuclease
MQFIDWWAHDRAQERKAFEDFIDWVYARYKHDGAMHIYHYAAYEVSAMRKLMGRFGTREMEVDNLLRNEVFVALYLGAAGSESWRCVEWNVLWAVFGCCGVTESRQIDGFLFG